MDVVYCFSNSFYNTNVKMLETTFELFKLSVEAANRFHDITIYTDEKSLNFIPKNTNVEIISDKFEFLDDFKIKTLQLTDNVIIDPDLILYQELILDETADASFDFRHSTNQPYLRPLLKPLLKNGVKDLFPGFEKINYMPNIGVLKINNKKLLNTYLDYYNKLKSFILDLKLENNIEFSIILGQ